MCSELITLAAIRMYQWLDQR